MNEFEILRSAAQAALEKETASEGEIALARLVVAYGDNHRDVSFKTLSALRERCDALLDCFRALRALMPLAEEHSDFFLEEIADAKKALEKASRYS